MAALRTSDDDILAIWTSSSSTSASSSSSSWSNSLSSSSSSEGKKERSTPTGAFRETWGRLTPGIKPIETKRNDVECQAAECCSPSSAADGGGGATLSGGCVNFFTDGENPIPELDWAPPVSRNNVILPWEGTQPPYTVNRFSAFSKNFATLTGNVFAAFDDKDWDGVVVAGGIVLASALSYGKGEINDKYPNSDIDLFIYGLEEEEAKKKLQEVAALLIFQSSEIVFVRTPHTITCVTSHRNVQCILRLHDTPESVIQAFDVDCCGVYYNGSTVVATDRAVRAISTGLNIADWDRRSWSFETRLVKYSRRGFGVAIKDAPADFRDKIAWLFESELPEEKAKRAKTEATGGDGSSGGSSSSSSSSYSRFRYHGRESDKEKGADSTIPQLLQGYWGRGDYDTYFETKGILKLLMAEYLRTQHVRLKKEGSRNRFIPNGRSYSNYGRGVAGAARLIKALGDDYGPSVYWPGYQTYEISKTMTKFLSKSNRKKPWAINFEIGPIPTGDEIEVASAKGATQDLWVKGIYRTN